MTDERTFPETIYVWREPESFADGEEDILLADAELPTPAPASRIVATYRLVDVGELTETRELRRGRR